MIEIEERKQAENEFRKLLDVFPQYMCVYSPDGSPLYANDGIGPAAFMLGVAAGALALRILTNKPGTPGQTISRRAPRLSGFEGIWCQLT
jgi:hypothetical protein